MSPLPLLPARPAPASRARLAPWLPSGRALTERDFAWRHRVVCLLLGAHVPLLVVLGVVEGVGWRGVVATGTVGLLLAVALGPFGRRLAAVCATTGLLSCSALLVHLYEGGDALHPHYLVSVAVVALYQDWRVLAGATGFVALEHTLAATLYGGPSDAGWAVPLVHTAFVLAEAAVLVLFWHANEQARAGEETLARALWEGQSSVRERLQETDRIRRDLIATVSHEFRTPLTGIRGSALTLLKRGDRLDSAGRERLLHAVLDQQERLSRLLENMLTASRATLPDADAVTDVHAVAAEVAMLAGAEHPEAPPVSVLVGPDTCARIEREALHQVLANLVDNAVVHGRPGAVPLITGGRDERGVWVAVSNDGSSMDPASAGRLFEPFAQADSGATRGAEGLGMGLYVVRRLVEVSGGDVEVRSEDGWVTVEVRLHAAGSPVGASS